jgi:hypothetical protein
MTEPRPIAMMRIERAASACVWNVVEPTLFVGGDGGLYRFELRCPQGGIASH